ncbi:hypothetical protein [Actinomyces sp. ZJ308]|uniref:hypothetical protein n=1 Tax=Actinomyces sp. ZJ308 TaxID=2708342 RepID=UPI001420CA18|nr:hypothetical protein [Actinomyces sp. ZJ308]
MRQNVAAPLSGSELPSSPSSLGSQTSWSKDIDGLLDVVGGAAGPVVLTTSGLMGLDPNDGSVRWSYHRDGAIYDELGRNSVVDTTLDRHLITSPDRRHVALRVLGPGTAINGEQSSYSDRDRNRSQPYISLVVDAVTGKVTNEHLSAGGALQLTDSALLDDTTAYSLANDAKLWDFQQLGFPTPSLGSEAHIGTAGHSSFLIDTDGQGNLSLAPQAHPSKTRPVPNLLCDQFGRVEVADGWVAYFDDNTWPKATTKTEAGQAHAVNLDGLAGVPGSETQSYDLGTTLGVNAIASRASGTLAMLPSSAPTDEGNRFPEFDSRWDGIPSVGQVFDPRSKTVAPAQEATGIAGIAVGITSPAMEENPGGQITARTPDGRTASLPIAPGTTFYSPGISEYSNAQLNDLAVAHSKDTALSAVNAPGATLIILNTAPPRDGRAKYYRILGITGGH